MLVWRICRKPYVSEVFSGEGARILGGRWNSEGVRMAYAADSLALAALEIFVHIGPSEDEPTDLIAVQAELPVDLGANLVADQQLPKDWYFKPELSRRAGNAWVKSARSLAVRVPSVVVEVEWNVLIHPKHRDFSKLKIVQQRPFRFDEWMFRRPHP